MRVTQTSDIILLFHTFLFIETEALTVHWCLITNLSKKPRNAVTLLTQPAKIQLRASVKGKLASDIDKMSPPRSRTNVITYELWETSLESQ